MRRTLTGALALLVLGSTALATTTRNVPQNYPSIQAAIDASLDGDTVVVAPGTYLETIDFLGKKIAVTGSGGASVTSIRAPAGGSVVSFRSGETKDSVLSGFSISGGTGTLVSGSGLVGGGIFCDRSSPTISHNVIRDNAAASGGGILCRRESAPIIAGNRVIANHAESRGAGICALFPAMPLILGNEILANENPWSGGGINCIAAVISGNLIKGNRARNSGGGIECFKALVTGNVIEGNEAAFLGSWGGGITTNAASTIHGNVIARNVVYGEGGGIFAGSDAPVIAGNLIVENRAVLQGGHVGNAYGGGIAAYGPALITSNTLTGNSADIAGNGLFGSRPTITNCILWDPPGYEIYGVPAINHSDVFGGHVGTGNIDTDPLFVDPAHGDYHLSATSPCLNAGDNDARTLPPVDIDGDARIHHGVVDIGADEYRGCLVTFRTFGVGLAGKGGRIPQLTGSSGSCGDGGHGMHITDGLGGTHGLLWIGRSAGDLPFFGGHFYVSLGDAWLALPIVLQGAPGSPGAGFLDLPGRDVGVWLGLALYAQATLLDPDAVRGVSLTNGLEATIAE